MGKVKEGDVRKGFCDSSWMLTGFIFSELSIVLDDSEALCCLVLSPGKGYWAPMCQSRSLEGNTLEKVLGWLMLFSHLTPYLLHRNTYTSFSNKFWTCRLSIVIFFFEHFVIPSLAFRFLRQEWITDSLWALVAGTQNRQPEWACWKSQARLEGQSGYSLPFCSGGKDSPNTRRSAVYSVIEEGWSLNSPWR